MKTKMLLKHPAGKKAVSIDSEKYDLLKDSLVGHLKKQGESTHHELLRAVTEDFKKHKTNFEGSVEWHMEWVKLDLEARKEIKRVGGKTPVTFMVAR